MKKAVTEITLKKKIKRNHVNKAGTRKHWCSCSVWHPGVATAKRTAVPGTSGAKHSPKRSFHTTTKFSLWFASVKAWGPLLSHPRGRSARVGKVQTRFTVINLKKNWVPIPHPGPLPDCPNKSRYLAPKRQEGREIQGCVSISVPASKQTDCRRDKSAWTKLNVMVSAHWDRN